MPRPWSAANTELWDCYRQRNSRKPLRGFSLEAHTFVPECNEVVNVVEDKDTCHVPDALKQVKNNTYIFHCHIGKGAKPGDPDFNLDASFKSTTQPILSLPAPQTATPPPAEILDFFFFFFVLFRK
ncbi:hypothetical protein Tco_0103794 [Tanacetum coccineum]